MFTLVEIVLLKLIVYHVPLVKIEFLILIVTVKMVILIINLHVKNVMLDALLVLKIGIHVPHVKNTIFIYQIVNNVLMEHIRMKMDNVRQEK